MKTIFTRILSLALFLIVPLFIIAQTVPREMVVMEIATGTWCTYCPGAAMGADDLLENGCRVAVIENHNGDAFANVYSNARNTYWGVTGFPTAVFDGTAAVVGGSHTSSMYPSYLPKYQARIIVPANILMSADITHTGLDYTAVITVTKIGTLVPASFKLHFFVTVSNIQVNWQGQTHLEHVDAMMVPDQNGTDITFTSGDTQVVTLNYSLDPTWPVEDIEFITFVQDATTTKEVFNGMKRAAVDLTPAFTASATQIATHETVTFTNGTTGGYIGVPETYSWSFPGGTPATSTDKNPVVTYDQGGVFDATLIVDRGTQVDTLVKPGYITVLAEVGIDPVKQVVPMIAPNPCNGNFKITREGAYDVNISDILGNVVYVKNGNAGTTNFSISLSAGTYFVSVQSGNEKKIQKLVVN